MTASPSHSESARSEQIAFRPESTTQARLAETLVALANAAGGLVLIGVDPRTGEPQGLEAPESALDLSLKAALATEPPLIVPLPQFDEVQGKQILRVRVPPGLPHVYSYKGKYLVRERDRNRPLNPRQLRLLMMERGAASFESLVPQGAQLEDLNWDKAGEYLARLTGRPRLEGGTSMARLSGAGPGRPTPDLCRIAALRARTTALGALGRDPGGPLRRHNHGR
jgi:predicted HTH transcriptional regulator